MKFVESVLHLLVWITLIPWWLYLFWSVVGRTFEWDYLAGIALPIVFWAGYNEVHKYNERNMTEEELLERYRRERDRGAPYARARERNKWRVNQWRIHK